MVIATPIPLLKAREGSLGTFHFLPVCADISARVSTINREYLRFEEANVPKKTSFSDLRSSYKGNYVSTVYPPTSFTVKKLPNYTTQLSVKYFSDMA